MFKRDDYKIGEHNVCHIHNDNGVFIDIIPELGAMISQIGLLDKKGRAVSILETDSAEELSTNPWFRGRILFPFNDRIPGGKYSYRGRDFQLPINSGDHGSSIHGLVYDQPFIEKEMILGDNNGEIFFSRTISKEDFDSYPFSVELHVHYTISESLFSVEYTIVNCDDQTLPAALGWHPYFTFHKKVNSLSLQGGSGHYVAVNESLNPTGDILSARGSTLDFSENLLIGDLELDLAYLRRDDGKTVLSDGDHKLNLYFDPGFFTFVQFFIPPGRQSIAIEPVTSATNSFNIPELGRMELNPGEKKNGLVTIHLS